MVKLETLMKSPNQIAELFSQLYGTSPRWIVRAPGRINLIGEHIDYLGGTVMPAAIDRNLTMAVRSNGTELINIWSSEQQVEDAPVGFGLSDLKPFEGDLYWLNYIGGVVEMLRRDGLEPIGFDALIRSDLPAGAGLSSSAALETATALAVECITGQQLDPLRRAELCRQAEHGFAGVPCGIMDQIAVGLGRKNHALMLDCSNASFAPVQIPEGIAILVSDTRVNHALGDGEYQKRRESCDQALQIFAKSSWGEVSLDDLETHKSELGPLLNRRARHVVSEMARVSEMSNALASGNLKQVAETMKSGHESLRDDFEVSCPELDLLVESAYDFGTGRGLVGARMTGGGFGGSTISLVREEAAESLKFHLEDRFRARFNSESNCFITQAADGASAQAFSLSL